MSPAPPAPPSEEPAVLAFQGVSRIYAGRAGQARTALQEVSFAVPPGRIVAILGRSGSGKSTLLNLAAGIDVPSRGRVRILGQDLAALTEGQRTRLRRERVGMVFQFFHLLPHLTVAENVALPGWIAGDVPGPLQERIQELLEKVGLADRAGDSVQTLSGGEMQRVALCRALLRRPRLLLADEPTGNLDDATGRVVMDLLVQLGGGGERALVFVTHDETLAALAQERWRLHSGRLERA